VADRIMYVKPGCPWCEKARDGLTAQGLDWEERDATTNRAWRDELHEYSRGTGPVPTIVAGEEVQVGWDGHG
jgi:glutaredoxin 3